MSILFFLFLQTIKILSLPVANAQSCQTPAQVQNVLVTYPSCVGDVCNFTQGNCSWGSVSGATANHVVITEVETGTTIMDQQLDVSVTSTVFSVKESNTYKCDVSAVNSCGAGVAGTSSLLCKVDGAVTTTPPLPTSVPPYTNNQLTQSPVVTLPVAGNTNPLLVLGIGGSVLILIGVTLFTV